MERHNAARAQRVDLLDHLRQERQYKAAACRKAVLAAQRRDAAALLLAGLSASMSILWSDSRSSGFLLCIPLNRKLFLKTRTRRRRTAGERFRRYGYRAYDARACLAKPFRASMALTEFSNAFSRTRLPMVTSTKLSRRPLRFLPSRTTTTSISVKPSGRRVKV
jgi:hypothetical protein